MGIQPRMWRRGGVILGAILMVVIFNAPGSLVLAEGSSTPGVKWYSYQEGRALGKQEHKKVFLSFFADWCTYCHKMEKESFRDPAIVDYLNRHFISIRANSDKETDLASDFFVRGLPTTWFLTATGEKIAGQPGYIPPQQLLQLLKFIQSDSYKDMSLKEFLKQ